MGWDLPTLALAPRATSIPPSNRPATRARTLPAFPLVEPPICEDIAEARILVVDDVDVNVRLLQYMLANAAYRHVDTTVDPTAVYELHCKNHYDLILLDIDMPRMSGLQVMESLRGVDADGFVPIIVVANEPDERLKALKAGARDFFSRPFDNAEVLTRIANTLESRMLSNAMRKRHRGLERDMAVAAEIYRALLPSTLPRCPGYEVVALNRPADDTSGDVYDIVARPEGSLLVLVGDATGHGIGPAIAATQLRSMVRMALRLGAPLERIVAEANKQLSTDLPSDRFVTAFIGELDPIAASLRYMALGQGPLLHWHLASATAEWRNASSPPFGVGGTVFDAPPPMLLAPGDVVVVATDGVFECTNGAGRMFGEAGVEAVMRDAAHIDAEAILQLLHSRTEQFGGAGSASDDATAVILKRTVKP